VFYGNKKEVLTVAGTGWFEIKLHKKGLPNNGKAYKLQLIVITSSQ